MSNEFSGTGNVGDQPLLKTVMVGSEERQVAELAGVLRRIPPGRQGRSGAGRWILARRQCLGRSTCCGGRAAGEERCARACRRPARRDPMDGDGDRRGAQCAASERGPSVPQPHTAGRGHDSSRGARRPRAGPERERQRYARRRRSGAGMFPQHRRDPHGPLDCAAGAHGGGSATAGGVLPSTDFAFRPSGKARHGVAPPLPRSACR